MGIVEMGGASTQIAFLPTGSILSDKFDMRIAARHYSLYVHSYLDYGASAASSWIDTHLATVDQPNKDPVTQPCLPTGEFCISHDRWESNQLFYHATIKSAK